LAKFRAAAQKHREQTQEPEEDNSEPAVQAAPSAQSFPTPQETSQASPTVSAPTQSTAQSVEQSAFVSSPAASTSTAAPAASVSFLGAEPAPAPQPAPAPVPAPAQPEKNIYYYTSSIGGLKELAQGINKAARKSSIPYAFTLNAGLSLHKLIRPFSILHVYVKPNDREFFEKALSLSECDESSAQLVLLIDTKGVLNSTGDVHGLSVVSHAQLRQDLLAAGEVDLANEIDSI
jgi:hypothetical protein